jgi:hypothetical protein
MQMELFPDLPKIEPEPFKPTTTCAQCSSIVAVRFNNGNLFFCTAQKGGKYGKKIKKSASNCELFQQGGGDILKWDGYFGGTSGAIKRGGANHNG